MLTECQEALEDRRPTRAVTMSQSGHFKRRRGLRVATGFPTSPKNRRNVPALCKKFTLSWGVFQTQTGRREGGTFANSHNQVKYRISVLR